jgi:hypothetical protein
MIGKDSNTIFQINRGNDVGYGGITYIDKDKSEYGLYGQEPIATPTQTKLLFTLNNSDNGITKPLVYHVTLGGKSDAKKTALIKEVSEKKNSGIAQALGIAENIENYTLLSPNSSGQYAFTTTNAQKQAILTVSNAFAKPTMMQTDIPFTATLSDIANDYEPYIKTIESPYTLKPGVIETSLQTILGTGAYVMQGDTQFMYKIQPKKNYGGDIIVTNVFGESIKVPMKLYIETIDPRVVVQQVLANSTLSILPSDSSFEDVLIQHKNIGEFPITFQACTLNGSYTP